MPPKYKYFLIGIFWIFSIQSYGQILNPDTLEYKLKQLGDYLLYRNHDTTYITSYADQLTLKLVAINKYSFFRIKDGISSTRLRYRPKYGINLGIGFAYKWIALDLTFNFGIREDINLKNSEAFNIQTRVFSSRQFIEGYLQYFYGHKLDNISGISIPLGDLPLLREDVRTISFGLQYLYAFDYDKFSLKAPFVLNEAQRKSTGSPIFGASFDFFNMDSDSSIVPNALKNYFRQDLQLTDVSVISLAVNLGYMYSFVWKKNFFLTLGLIPGLNFNLGDSRAEERNIFRWNVSYKIKTMNALGYNARKFYAGLQLVGDFNNVYIAKKQSVLFSVGNLRFFVGYRFLSNKKENDS